MEESDVDKLISDHLGSLESPVKEAVDVTSDEAESQDAAVSESMASKDSGSIDNTSGDFPPDLFVWLVSSSF